jgi:ankyrin repeat protein
VPLIHAAIKLDDIESLRYLLFHELNEAAAHANTANGRGQSPLHWAANLCRVGAIETLLLAGAVVDVQDVHGATPLHLAAARRSPECIRALCDAGANPLALSALGITPLFAACDNPNDDAAPLNAMLASCAARDSPIDIDRPCRDGQTSLHAAAREGRERILTRLLAANASLRLRSGGDTPLLLAPKSARCRPASCCWPRASAARAKFKTSPIACCRTRTTTATRRCTPQWRWDSCPWCASCCASRRRSMSPTTPASRRVASPSTSSCSTSCRCSVAAMRRHRRCRCRLESRTMTTTTTTQRRHRRHRHIKPLRSPRSRRQCFPGHPRCLRHLMLAAAQQPVAAACGGNNINNIQLVSTRSADSTDLLFEAAKRGDADEVKRLVSELGVSVDAKDRNRNTALHHASREGHVAVIKQLQRHKAKLTSQNRSKETALHLAAQYGHAEAARALLKVLRAEKQGVLLEAKCERTHQTALHYAMQWARADTATLDVLLACANVALGARDASDNTPLHVGAEFGNADAVAALLTRAGVPPPPDAKPLIDVDAANSGGNTALHVACAHGHVNIVRRLAFVGANKNARNAAQQTPLHLAVAGDRDEVVAALVVLKADRTLVDQSGETALALATRLGHKHCAALLS